MKNNWLLTALLLLAVALSGEAQELRLPKVIGDNMVLQQGKPVMLWGEAAPEAKVEVLFQRQKLRTVADAQGRWMVRLAALTATNKPQQLVVRSGQESLTVDNILIGEVWLASGQSNMEYSMANHPKYAKPRRGDRDYQQRAFESADNPLIRVMHVQKNLKADTLPSLGWRTLSQESLKPVSAAAYFFAEMLADSLKVPVGIISSAWGGTSIEAWTPVEAYTQSEQFAEEVDRGRYLGPEEIAKRYNKMIAPLIPFAMRGIIWYQGEQNLVMGDLDIYTEKQRLLIESWRTKWADPELSFYYVQLAPHIYSQRRNDVIPKTWETLALFRAAQEATMYEVPRTGMVVTTDLVDKLSDIHPPYKWEVGRRLARWALANDYGFQVEFRNPSFESMEVEGNRIIVTFKDVAGGLVTSNGEAPDWFWIADKQGRFFKAEAQLIAPNKVALQQERIKHPVVVRFGWDEIATPNLRSGAGLPALPFIEYLDTH